MKRRAAMFELRHGETVDAMTDSHSKGQPGTSLGPKDAIARERPLFAAGF
jgi:hypothetical protein